MPHVQVKFRSKNLAKRSFMSAVAKPQPRKQGRPRVASVSSGPMGASFSSLDSMVSQASSAKSRKAAGTTHVHVHLRLGKIQVNATTLPTPEMPAPSEPVAAEPIDASTWHGWVRQQWQRAQPVIGPMLAVAMFFLDRIGFGISLNQLVSRRT